MKIETQDIISETVKQMVNAKPNWFHAHEKSDLEEFGAIRNTLKSQDAVLAELKKAHIELMKIQEEYHEKTLPVFEYLNEITVGRKIRSDYLKATGMWTGVLLGIASIGTLIWGIFKFLVFNAK